MAVELGDPDFTGERFVSGAGGVRVAVEHLHRYHLAKEFVSGKSVVDIGSGSGYGSQILEGFSDYVGIDIDKQSVDFSNEKYGSESLIYIQGDATNIPLENEIADVVVSFETLEHVNHPELIVQEARRILKPNGLFIFSTPDRDNYNPSLFEPNPFHVHEMNQSEILELFQGKFENVKLYSQSIIQSSLISSNDFPSRVISDESVVEMIKSAAPPATYWLGVASSTDLPHLPSTIFPLIEDRNIDAELVKTFLQLKKTEEELLETRNALWAADKREASGRDRIRFLEEEIEELRTQTHLNKKGKKFFR